MKAQELKAGKTVDFNKFYVGYCQIDKLYFAGRHMSRQRLFQCYTLEELKQWVSWNK